MRDRGKPRWADLSLAQQFMLASLAILLASMLGVGWWVGQQIEEGVVHRTASTTALYAQSFLGPQLQGVGRSDWPTPERAASLARLLQDIPLGQQIVAFKLWSPEGRVLYSTTPSAVGAVFPSRGGESRAWKGEVVARISDLRDEENAAERARFDRLLEFYIPMRQEGTERIIAVAEFYQRMDELEREVAAARWRSWLVVGMVTAASYLLLIGIVRRGSDTIVRQQSELNGKIALLTGLLKQNEELHERVRRAATRTTELNERFLRRISAEVHDGPAQDLSLALLRLEGAGSHLAECSESCPLLPGGRRAEDLSAAQFSVTRALQDLRSLLAGLRLPELGELSLEETVARVVRAHERRTRSRVELDLGPLPEQAPLSLKITLYRLVQEALSNSYRHGGGVDQQVRVSCQDDRVEIVITDRGPGFRWQEMPAGDQHLGLVGMRERVESQGGVFTVDSAPGMGTRVMATLPLDSGEDAGASLDPERASSEQQGYRRGSCGEDAT